jgi:hypothetical protein
MVDTKAVVRDEDDTMTMVFIVPRSIILNMTAARAIVAAKRIPEWNDCPTEPS